MYYKILSFIGTFWTKRIVSKAHLCLCLGDSIVGYSKYTKKIFSIINTHVTERHISSIEEIENKKNKCMNGPLEIIYVGRMSEMKGPFLWIQSIWHAHSIYQNIRATWIGDGELKNEMIEMIRHYHAEKYIRLENFIRNHDEVINRIKKADILVMTHITAEQTRCVIESLTVGTPVVGFVQPFFRTINFEK